MKDNPHDNVINSGLHLAKIAMEELKEDKVLAIFVSYEEMDRGDLFDLRDDIIALLSHDLGFELIMTTDGTTVLMKAPE